ncbi:unnamed protein product [Rotaria sp. Silwood1]|nr:unnamed protein product [Rotaria sp. Silwood1]CAF3965736.1 unnamed protein product [Rotaria sp. Silwood1]CAF4783061.1 unnamed protein product [Rotaria sp. Silwood1]CAF5048706.1 unnamed protein product [Rotaria sp. Silwood1]
MQTTSETANQRQAQTTAEIAANLTAERARHMSSTSTSKHTASATTTEQTTAPLSSSITATTTTKSHTCDPVDRIEKCILHYIRHCTQHVKKTAETRIKLAKVQMDEYN